MKDSTSFELVWGGTKDPHSNRLKEKSWELDLVSLPSQDRFNFLDCNSIEEVIEGLEILNDKNWHIVGSRDYVYHSEAMLEVIKSLQDWVENDKMPHGYAWRELTRGCNLRQAVFELLTGQAYYE